MKLINLIINLIKIMSKESKQNPLSIEYTEQNIKTLTRGKGLCGLENLGNTCYMSSIIQCLSNTNQFREMFLLNNYKLFERNDIPHFIMVSEMNKVLRGLWFDNAIVSPKGFFHYLQILSFKIGTGQFVGHNQNDSSELLLFLLDTIHEGLSKTTDITFNEQDTKVMDTNQTNIYHANKQWFNSFKTGISPLIDMFYNQLHSTIICNNCNHLSHSYDPSIIITLPVPNKEDSNTVSLYDCLKLYTSQEKLDDNNKYICEKCNVETNAYKKLNLFKTSKYLILSFKRFQNDGDKINTFIDYPIDNLVLDDYCDTPINSSYSLYAVSNHTGNLKGGHYFSYCKNADKWYEYNDHMVMKLTNEQIVSNNAYILLYEKND